MNENIDLTKILKDCPNGWKFYSSVYGDVEFCYIGESDAYPIKLNVEGECDGSVAADGKHCVEFGGECTLFPSREQRDWSKFAAPWYKKEKFDPNTLQPFDRVICRCDNFSLWQCNLFSNLYPRYEVPDYPVQCMSATFEVVVPYNEETKHLVGTTDEAPEYYRYWED